MARILLVEDDQDLRDMVHESLEREGFSTWPVSSIREARAAMDAQPFELVLLDWMLPDASGLQWLQQLRRDEKYHALPVIMLTAKGEISDRVRGLDSGADDYVVKPFSLKELLARVRSRLRHNHPETGKGRIERFGLLLDTDSHRVHAGNQPLRLGPTEFRLLQHFMSNPDRVFSRSQLLDAVWGMQTFIEERTVDVHIRRLRKALGTADKQHLVQTVRGSGYRFSED